MGLRTGGRRAKGLKNRVKSSEIELRFREVRSEGCTSCTPVQQALIYPVSQTWQFCFGRTAFLLLFFLLNWEARRPERQAGPCASPVPPTTKNPQTKWPGDHGGAFSTAGEPLSRHIIAAVRALQTKKRRHLGTLQPLLVCFFQLIFVQSNAVQQITLILGGCIIIDSEPFADSTELVKHFNSSRGHSFDFNIHKNSFS